jgi:TonB-linked SusC/RagA family outer membrane protein
MKSKIKTNGGHLSGNVKGVERFILSALTFLLLSLIPSQVYSQTLSVRGIVKDQQGTPIIGASVVQKDVPKNGTISDLNGEFMLQVPKGSSLVVSYVGYIAKTVSVQSSKTILVVLEENSKVLNDVVVVAYGTQKKISVTGAVSAVNTVDLKKASTPNLDVALQGRITGLATWQNGGGQPGVDASTIFLRGTSTLNGSSPLVLLDGVATENIEISKIDPNEVESISVLKDASSTALFGVRGANGVIIINTRHGRNGKPQLSVSYDQSYTSFTRVPSRIHSWDFMALRNEAKKNDGLEAEFSDELIAKYKNPLFGLDKSDPDYAQKAAYRQYMYCDHYWFDEFFKKNTPQTKVNMNLSGGSDRFTYFVNANYIKQGGNLNSESKKDLGYDPSVFMDRWNFRGNMEYNVTKTLKATLNLGTYIQRWNMPGAFYYSWDTNWMMIDLFNQCAVMRPMQPGPLVFPGMGIDSRVMVQPDGLDRSPYDIINRYGYARRTKINLTGQGALEWDLSTLITKGLKIRGMVTYDEYGMQSQNGSHIESHSTFTPDYEHDTFTLTKPADNSPMTIARGTDANYSINGQAAITYARTFDKHDVTGMLLGQRDYWESGAQIPFNVIGLSGRFAYGYDSRYLAEFDFGYNGSEQFNPDKRYGFFPAYSLGWVASNEKFMKSFTWLNNLKFRFSTGKVGNDQLGGTRFLYQDNIQVVGGGYVGGLGTAAYSQVNQGLLGNKEITWETATKNNYGIDLGLFKVFTFSFNYYTENRKDILITRQSVPAFQGISLGNVPKANMGKMKNHGIEIEFGFNKQIFNGFNLRVNGNFGTNRNKVVFADEPIRTEDYACRYRQTGYRLGQCFGYKIDYSSNGGYYVSAEDIANSPKIQFGTPRPGDFKYIDENNDGKIDEKDQVPIKWSAIPEITYGLNIACDYKGFDFSIFFTGIGRMSSMMAGNLFENGRSGCYYDFQRFTGWTQERYDNHEKISYPALTTLAGGTSLVANDYFIQDRSFLRLKNLQIGYTLPKSLLSFMRVKSCRVYVSGQNLCVWDHQKCKSVDPEQGSGIQYPITKMWNFGVNVNF